MNSADAPRLDQQLFAPGPARDNRFRVVERWCDCDNLNANDPNKSMEFLHRQMNEEVDGMECAAQSLVDFSDAPWELRMQIARQVSDEARHVGMFKRVYCMRGGVIGEYPVMNFQYRIITNLPTLEGRLAVQNRLFEAEGVDAVEPEIAKARERGDETMADLFDAQLADEICHVRYANKHIQRVIHEDPAKVMEIGRAMNDSSRAFLQVMGSEAVNSVSYGINEAGRVEAGFNSEEVAVSKALKESQPGQEEY